MECVDVLAVGGWRLAERDDNCTEIPDASPERARTSFEVTGATDSPDVLNSLLVS